MRKLYPLVFLFSLLGFSNLNAQLVTESFEDGIPSDWSTYTEAGFDFVSWYEGEVNLFKQSDGEEVLMLISPEWDLSEFGRMELDVYGFNLSFISTTVPELHLGYLATPNDPESFTSIHTQYVTNNTFETYEFNIGHISERSNLVFRLEGDPSHIIYVDNLALYDNSEQNNVPEAVQSLSLESALDPEPKIQASWTNPSLEIDGDALSDLTSINFMANNDLVFELSDPMISRNETQEISVPSSGFYAFEVFATNSAGDGYVIFSDRVWAGLDVPGAVTDVSISKTGQTADIVWSAPTVGANGAYFDEVIETYRIERSDGKVFSIGGDQTEFRDMLDIQGSINYTIIPENASGRGTPFVTDVIYHVEDPYIYYEDFFVDVVERPNETLDYEYKWTNQGNQSNGIFNHFMSSLADGEAGEMAYLWGQSSTGNDIVRAVSPKLNTEGLPVIAIEFNMHIEFPNNPDFELVLETTSDGGNSWTEVQAWQYDITTIEKVKKVIDNDDVGSNEFQFALSIRGNTVYPNFARFDNFRVYFQAGIDAKALNSTTVDLSEPGNTLQMLGTIENGSSEVIDIIATLKLIERFSNTVAYEKELSVLDMGVGEIRDIEFGNWFSEEGEYALILDVRADDDEVIFNNSFTKNVNILQLMDRDLVLVEEFTGTWCAPCTGAALGLEELAAGSTPIAVVAYHRSDDYETNITEPKMTKYGVLGFPTVVFDGGIQVVGADVGVSSIDLYLGPATESATRRSPVQVEFIESYLEDADTYKATIDVTSLSPIRNRNLVLSVAVTENHIEEEWQSLDILDYVQRNYSEQSIDLEDLSSRKEFTFDLPAEMVTENGEIIAWVQSVENNEVYNASKIDMSMELISTSDLLAENIKIYPVPARDKVFIDIENDNLSKVSVMDFSGRIIQAKANLDSGYVEIGQFDAGTYLLKIETVAGAEAMKKIIVIE